MSSGIGPGRKTMEIGARQLYPGVFEVSMDGRRMLATVNLTPGIDFYGEQLIRVGDLEYRAWSPYRSKLAAAIVRGLRGMPISGGMKVLYLGVASGTTCSHISDIVGNEGHIWGVDFSPRPLRSLIENLASRRRNISPILGDARDPEAYSSLLPMVDLIYADVAQPDQSRILSRNAEYYLRPGGWALLAIKSRSIDVTRPPEEVYGDEVEGLRRGGFEVLDVVELDPYERDHAMVLASYGE